MLSSFDTSHGDVVVGTIWSAFLAELRLWGLAAGAVGLIAAAAFEPGLVFTGGGEVVRLVQRSSIRSRLQ